MTCINYHHHDHHCILCCAYWTKDKGIVEMELRQTKHLSLSIFHYYLYCIFLTMVYYIFGMILIRIKFNILSSWPFVVGSAFMPIKNHELLMHISFDNSATNIDILTWINMFTYVRLPYGSHSSVNNCDAFNSNHCSDLKLTLIEFLLWFNWKRVSYGAAK